MTGRNAPDYLHSLVHQTRFNIQLVPVPFLSFPKHLFDFTPATELDTLRLGELQHRLNIEPIPRIVVP